MELPKNKSDLQDVIQHAVGKLFEHQPNGFEFTARTGQTEWNLAHHLAIELTTLIPSLDCDLDVLKMDYGNMRPDIVFHKRGTHESNYLVIEMKRDGSTANFANDIAKIENYWFKAPLRYRFGAAVNLRAGGTHQIQVFQNPE